jgi:hypothetical protein
LEPDANLRRVESLGHPLWHDQAVHWVSWLRR